MTSDPEQSRWASEERGSLDWEPGVRREVRLAVAGVGVTLEMDGPAEMRIDSEYEAFLLDGSPPMSEGDAPLRLRVHAPPFPTLESSRLLFDTGHHWSVFDVDGAPAITHAAAQELETLSEVILTGAGELFHIHAGMPGACIRPLEPPMGQLLWRELFPTKEAILLHAAGLMVDGRALVFAGHSGAGKSTLLRHFHSSGLRKLSDDRIALRCIREGAHREWWAFGTPWPGEDDVIDPAGAPVAAILLLEKAPENRLLPLRGAQAVAEITARAFLPYWSRQGISHSLALVDRLVQEVPCHRFQFTPTKDAVPVVLDLMPSH